MQTTRKRSPSFFVIFVVLYCFFVLRQWVENVKSIAICHPSITFFFTSLSDKAGDLEHTVIDDPHFSTIYHGSSQIFPMMSGNLMCAVQPKKMIESFQRNLGIVEAPKLTESEEDILPFSERYLFYEIF